MIDAVFISDLHLHPDEIAITKRFNQFLDWAAQNTRSVYILGDFFHVWPGDDALDHWSESIAASLAGLAESGVSLYYMHGNRDFLLGARFAQLAHLTVLTEPEIITLGNEQVLLVHGDRYCINDRGHQRLRYLTRNRIFQTIFLRIPYRLRSKLVNKVREHSQTNCNKPMAQLDVVPSAMLEHMQQLNINTLIHGHTHKPGLTVHQYRGSSFRQFVLSDWDDNPLLLCYDESSGFYFNLFVE